MRAIPRALRTATAAALACAALLNGCSLDRVQTITPSAPVAAAPYRLLLQPGDGYQPLIDLIASAGHSLRMTMYQLSDPEVVTALIDAHQRSVEVKVLLNAAYHGTDTNAGAYNTLNQAGVAVRWTSTTTIYHQKTITVDDHTSAVGTGNLTRHHYDTSRDAYILVTNPADVTAIAATFDTDFTNPTAPTPAAGTPTPRLVWSPNSDTTFLQRITSATRTLDITSVELADRPTVAAINKAARRGVACRIILPEQPADTRTIDQVTAAGCGVHISGERPGTLFMHQKMLLVDGHHLIIGSHNLSATSLIDNRELSLQLDTTTAPDILATLAATFDNDYQQAPPAPSSHR